MLTWFTCSDHISEIMHDLTHESAAARTVVICCIVQSNATAHFVGGKCRNHEPENVVIVIIVILSQKALFSIIGRHRKGMLLEDCLIHKMHCTFVLEMQSCLTLCRLCYKQVDSTNTALCLYLLHSWGGVIRLGIGVFTFVLYTLLDIVKPLGFHNW